MASQARGAGRSGATPLWPRALQYWMRQYRRTWRGSAVSSVLAPLGFLTAMGIGLGLLIDRGRGSGELGGAGYLSFIAPGLLAATAMQTAVFECTYPVMGAIRWNRQYHAMLAGPLGVRDVLRAHLAFVGFRLASTLAVFWVVAAGFGAVHSWWAPLAVPVGVLTGAAFATPVFAFAARQETDEGFALLFRFLIVPMFLFSGTFFPITGLPGWLQPVAELTPLWHGVSLCRALMLGSGSWVGAAGHVGYLAVWALGGYLLAARELSRRLVV